MHRTPRIFLSAGEASGDHYGAQLIESLAPLLREPKFYGLGGKEMEAAGQVRVVRAEDVAHMGITEILRHIPKVVGSYRRLVQCIRKVRPDVAVLIDFPDVNFRLARHLHRMGVPVLWFVSPQLWAWKRQRLRWVQKRISKMFVIFPFEEEFYRNRGVDAKFVGHPLADLPLPSVSREEFARQYGLDAAKEWVALLPGSRRREVTANLPAMLGACQLLESDRYEFVIPVANTIAPAVMEEIIAAWREHSGGSNLRFHLMDDARAALLHARASVVASGTATVQAALIGNPFLVVYQVSGLTFQIAKRLIRYPAEIPTPKDEHGNLPIAMPNLIAGRRIVPELINNQMLSSNIALTLKLLLEETTARKSMLDDLTGLRSKMKTVSGRPAILELRDAVLEAMAHGTTAASSSGRKVASNQ